MFKSRNLSDLTEKLRPVTQVLLLFCGRLMTGQTYSVGRAGELQPLLYTAPSLLPFLGRNVSENLHRGPACCLIGEVKKSFATVLWNMDQIWVRNINLTSHSPCCLRVVFVFQLVSHIRGDAADSLQQAPRVAVMKSDEESVKCLQVSQVLWDWESGLQSLWKPGLTTCRWSHRSDRNICSTPALGADAVVPAHWELKGKELWLN